ncbi:MAG: hypothetical protein IPO37_13620 [Saprospiraceae bacterium]|nr:hypothetical protein [Saprospiraceae bacterium]
MKARHWINIFKVGQRVHIKIPIIWLQVAIEMERIPGKFIPKNMDMLHHGKRIMIDCPDSPKVY